MSVKCVDHWQPVRVPEAPHRTRKAQPTGACCEQPPGQEGEGEELGGRGGFRSLRAESRGRSQAAPHQRPGTAGAWATNWQAVG